MSYQAIRLQQRNMAKSYRNDEPPEYYEGPNEIIDEESEEEE